MRDGWVEYYEDGNIKSKTPLKTVVLSEIVYFTTRITTCQSVLLKMIKGKGLENIYKNDLWSLEGEYLGLEVVCEVIL